jgi:WD40 repeat protein
MNARVSGFGSTILDMSFSPDGRYLAASLGGSSGAAIVDVYNAKLLKTLDGYGSKSKGIAFSQDGHLATTSYDGKIRLYARDFTLIKSVTPAGGKEPDGLAFSPDGKRLAVGYNDTSSVLVLDAVSLNLLYEADNKDVSRNLSRPVWSPDGSYLYAGGTSSARFDNLWWFFVRRWEQGGRGGYTDYPAVSLNIWGLSMLPNGNLAAAGAAPNLSMLSPSGTLLWNKPLATLDYNVADRAHLRLSPDGRRIGATSYGSSPFQFSAAERFFLAEASQESSFRDSAGSMIFTDWKGTKSPKLNGTPLAFLQSEETSRAVSVRADGRFAVLGTGWAVYGIGPDGKQAWRIPSPADTWAVNIAGNGQVFTAAYGDGTIRWHRVSDGKEILAFFIHADKTRWVLWTPSGYYDASPGGEELIGWHINRGIDGTPDFYPASTFRDRFYRPDVVQEILLSFDEARAVETANQRRNIKTTVSIAQVLPPTVRILSPSDGAEIREQKLSLEVEVSAPKDAPLTELQVRLNGRLLADARGIAAVGTGSTENRTVRRVEIDLSKLGGGEAVITVQAANQHGFGPAAEVSVRLSETRFKEFTAARSFMSWPWVSPATVTARSNFGTPPRTLRCGGILPNAVRRLVPRGRVRLLTDQQATLSAIRDGLFWLEEQVTSTDSAQIFIAGHGINDNTGQLYFTPHDVDVNSLRRTGSRPRTSSRQLATCRGGSCTSWTPAIPETSIS